MSFSIEHVQLQFGISEITTLAVSGNILSLALVGGRVICVDLTNPQEIEEVDVAKDISNLYLSPDGVHLLVTTLSGNNYLLGTSVDKFKSRLVNRIKGTISAVAWDLPSLKNASVTGSSSHLLIGLSNGHLYEAVVDLKENIKWAKHVWKTNDDAPIDGICIDSPSSASLSSDNRKVIITAGGSIYHWQGHILQSKSSPYYSSLLSSEPVSEIFDRSPFSSFSVYQSQDVNSQYAWLTEPGILYGDLFSEKYDKDTKDRFFTESRVFLSLQLPPPKGNEDVAIKSLMLTKYHIICLRGNEIFSINRLNGDIVYNDVLASSTNERFLGLTSDLSEQTFWIFTSENIYELVVLDEETDIWKSMVENKDYEEALSVTKDQLVRDIIWKKMGWNLIDNRKFLESAIPLAHSTELFETVCLKYMENKQYDALRTYLEIKLKSLEKTQFMQRVMLSSWIIELFIEKMNELDDYYQTLDIFSSNSSTSKKEFNALDSEFNLFITTFKDSLDVKTVYDIISSHNRQAQLLFFANEIQDYDYLISYWVRLYNWEKVLDVLITKSSPDDFYKYSSVLLVNYPKQTINTWIRLQDLLDPTKFIPALLSYNNSNSTTVDLEHNQAVRYLVYLVQTLNLKDSIIHNTLLAIYITSPSHASNNENEEEHIIAYLSSSYASATPYSSGPPVYDSDFILRLCLLHHKLKSAIYIYSMLGLYEEAVKLALGNNLIEIAAEIADKPEIEDKKLRKQLWLEIAKEMIQGHVNLSLDNKQDNGEIMKDTLHFLQKSQVLKINDLLPLFPNFHTLQNFKSEIVSCLENYSSTITSMNSQINESISTSQNLHSEIEQVQKNRYLIIEPSEICKICSEPLLLRKFVGFPCEHFVHYECIIKYILKNGGYKAKKDLVELQKKLKKRRLRANNNANITGFNGFNGASNVEDDLITISDGSKMTITQAIEEIITRNCPHCSDMNIDSIERGFIEAGSVDNAEDWTI